MERKEFLRYAALVPLIPTAMKLQSLQELTSSFTPTEKMPALFVGHGNPMNAIEDNRFSQGMKDAAKRLPIPKAILMVSAHWETRGSFVTAQEKPATIHDFGGFPQKLFDAQYPAPGSPWLAEETIKMAGERHVEMSHQWGFDHGAWSVTMNMFPEANIPMIQLSLDVMKTPAEHYALAKELQKLREKGVMVIGSGNMVHSFEYAKVISTDFNASYAHDWALEANALLKEKILNNDAAALADYTKLGDPVRKAVPTPEHYLPMLYALAMRDDKDSLAFFNDDTVAGSFSMTSFVLS